MEKMREADFTVSSMHGDMLQKERDEIMKEFRSGQPGADNDRGVGARYRRAAGVAGQQLRPAEQS